AQREVEFLWALLRGFSRERIAGAEHLAKLYRHRAHFGKSALPDDDRRQLYSESDVGDQHSGGTRDLDRGSEVANPRTGRFRHRAAGLLREPARREDDTAVLHERVFEHQLLARPE